MLKHLPIRLIKGTDYSRQWVERQTENLWRKILDHSRPRIIIAIQPDKYLCRAGRVEQIAICDLQHGLIDSVTNPYYRELVENAANQDLPNVFLCWDSRTASIFEKLTVQKGIAVHVLGNPWFQRFLPWIPMTY
ncbi:hypothetical protein [Cylindrospermopsis raciborskii]|uniref:hypothetical protein n=1 Tax=Cylindrospermopsis raciborskii TaxID=77022 RepID=UPI001143B3FE|nr:hypothetical protein [Cylindrospermopsis raciborskii]TPX27641.1 hypothetical protein FIV49_15905 [Cylindrospermopsis raciborskii GIHE 2018]